MRTTSVVHGLAVAVKFVVLAVVLKIVLVLLVLPLLLFDVRGAPRYWWSVFRRPRV